MLGVGRDLCGSASPTLLPKQGHLQQAAQVLVQAGLEYLQRRRLHNLPGQPVPVLHHPQREEVLPHVQTEELTIAEKLNSLYCRKIELSTLFSDHVSISSLSLTYHMETEPIPMVVLRCNCDIKATVGADSSSQVQAHALALSQLCVWVSSLCTPWFLHTPETCSGFCCEES